MCKQLYASVSVVIPCYQCAHTIFRAVESIVQQTLKPFEVILVDDGSDSETIESLYEVQNLYGSDWIKILESPENKGPSVARNKGWNYAVSSYVAFLDADDSWHPQKIEIQYLWMMEHPKIIFTGHHIRVKPVHRSHNIDISKVVSSRISNKSLLWSNCFSTPTVMIRADIDFKFDEAQFFAEDYLLWLKISFSTKEVYLFNEELAFIYKEPFGEAGLSQNLWLMEKGELIVYWKLYKSEDIALYHFAALWCYSMIKYFRRVLVSCITPSKGGL